MERKKALAVYEVGVLAEKQRAGDQTAKTLLRLRDLILSGALEPGERLSELGLVERLGVSRTPVRAALARLEDEGFLAALPSGGYALRRFAVGDVIDAIDVRGALEGLAARLAAERRSEDALAALDSALAALDALDAGAAPAERLAAYTGLNAQFHDAVLAAAASPALTDQLARATARPFAAASGFLQVQSALPDAGLVLTVAQEQHRAALEAIFARDGARAEAVMREHARLAARNFRSALTRPSAFEKLPGAALIAVD